MALFFCQFLFFIGDGFRFSNRILERSSRRNETKIQMKIETTNPKDMLTINC